VIDHGGGAHQPSIASAALLVVAFLDAKDRGFLLGFADEDNAFVAVELGAVAGGDVILALSFLKSDYGNVMGLGERLQLGDKLSGDLSHHVRGSNRLSSITKESQHALVVLQTWCIKVQVHAVDAFHFQGHVLADDLGYVS
jgi:hypothetical protein